MWQPPWHFSSATKQKKTSLGEGLSWNLPQGIVSNVNHPWWWFEKWNPPKGCFKDKDFQGRVFEHSKGVFSGDIFRGVAGHEDITCLPNCFPNIQYFAALKNTLIRGLLGCVSKLELFLVVISKMKPIQWVVWHVKPS